ncbi:hypothetical protein PXD04_10335 [Methanosphaera sp. ISO3-F5]|uniref:hypothetical protein n=1 Tax=Methanosphaera sp. ISO3-F5 TaxID=1452353 RepID=UPI002B26168A|nr:hypothetical protein [Methanosphaera sp. ISO3-F5]WQH64088.1 hypothetical protein PXD04_10335 [Methanosphaera sp. ISO3-F5]
MNKLTKLILASILLGSSGTFLAVNIFMGQTFLSLIFLVLLITDIILVEEYNDKLQNNIK